MKVKEKVSVLNNELNKSNNKKISSVKKVGTFNKQSFSTTKWLVGIKTFSISLLRPETRFYQILNL